MHCSDLLSGLLSARMALNIGTERNSPDDLKRADASSFDLDVHKIIRELNQTGDRLQVDTWRCEEGYSGRDE